MAEDIDLKALLEQAKQFNSKLDSFREHFEARFDQQTELIKSEVKNLSVQISTTKKN
jgi:phage-related minor tail protein